MILGIWRNASPRRKRILSAIAIFVIALIITIIGSLVPVDAQQANQINENLNQTVTSLDEEGVLPQFIFGNNFIICLLMFIPVLGPLLGFYALFNTGIAVSAIATAEGYPLILVFLSLVLTPVFWLEFAAYSIAIGESIWLFRRITQGRGWRELKNACIFVSICAVLLLLGAVIEAALISIAT
ncbi:MAG: stage II sporulation protein M [Crenarchaeota archaeon]|nr:stage II sporulation protein M [Thermoproteota archaeon]